jgi:hypothetical protein
MDAFRITLAVMTAVSLVLPAVSYRYFIKLMKLVKIRIGTFLVAGSATILAGYLFFLLPWLVIGDSILEIRIFSQYVIMTGLLILVYAVIRIYLDWREVIK